MKQNNKKAVIYCRVASAIQDDRSKSIAGQEEICREHARINGYEITNVFADYTSSSNPKRKGFEQMIKSITNKNVDVVCITSLDRISRNIEQTHNFLALLKKHHIELVIAKDPESVLLDTMLASFATYHNQMISLRVRAAIARKKSLLRSGASTKI